MILLFIRNFILVITLKESAQASSLCNIFDVPSSATCPVKLNGEIRRYGLESLCGTENIPCGVASTTKTCNFKTDNVV